MLYVGIKSSEDNFVEFFLPTPRRFQAVNSSTQAQRQRLLATKQFHGPIRTLNTDMVLKDQKDSVEE